MWSITLDTMFGFVSCAICHFSTPMNSLSGRVGLSQFSNVPYDALYMNLEKSMIVCLKIGRAERMCCQRNNSKGASCTLCDSYYSRLVTLYLAIVVKEGTENTWKRSFLDVCISFWFELLWQLSWCWTVLQLHESFIELLLNVAGEVRFVNSKYTSS